MLADYCLRFFSCMAQRMETNAAPWEKPINPSNGPDSSNVFSIKATLSVKPTDKLLGTVALNTRSSVLNHQPNPEIKTIHKLFRPIIIS